MFNVHEMFSRDSSVHDMFARNMSIRAPFVMPVYRPSSAPLSDLRAAYQRIRTIPDARHDAALLREAPGQDQRVHAEGDGAPAATRQVHHRRSVASPLGRGGDAGVVRKMHHRRLVTDQ